MPQLKVNMTPLLAYVEQLIRKKDSCVLVVTPGCLSDFRDSVPVSVYLAKQMAMHFSLKNIPANIQ